MKVIRMIKWNNNNKINGMKYMLVINNNNKKV